MKKTNKLIRICAIMCLCAIMFSLIACDQRLDGGENDNGVDNTVNTNLSIRDVVDSFNIAFNEKDFDASYSESSATYISFSQNSASVSGAGASASGANVTITSAGTYMVSGSSTDGSITVNTSNTNKVQIVLCGVDLTNADGPAVHIKSGKKVVITLASGTENSLADGNKYEIEDAGATVDGAIFSKSDLVLNGSGKLSLNGNNAHGIVSKDKLAITGGVYNITSNQSAICGKDNVKISGADITINAGKDGIKSNNDLELAQGFVYIKDGSFSITSANDAIQAETLAYIEGGEFTIKTTSTSSAFSAKAIKAGGAIAISGGKYVINSQDDAIHSNGNAVIAGGEFTVYAADDAIHADDTLSIIDGSINVEKSYEGIEASNINISGGYIEINSTDDGMNAAGGNDSNTGVAGRPGNDFFGSGVGSIVISGGYLIMHNEGDGIDSNGTVEISGGVVLVDGPQATMNGSLDYGKSAKITGGIVVTLGNNSMAQNFTEATQGSILVSSSGYFTAGTTLVLCDENDKVVLAFTSTKAFSGALFSAPEIEKGKTYTFYIDATVNGLDENGFAHNTTKTGGQNCGSVTLDDYICGQGSGMPGGMPPGGRPR